jgi:hypothetical protein
MQYIWELSRQVGWADDIEQLQFQKAIVQMLLSISPFQPQHCIARFFAHLAASEGEAATSDHAIFHRIATLRRITSHVTNFFHSPYPNFLKGL